MLEINCEVGMHYKFIEIGTSDFDTEIQKCDDNVVGLSIDALKFYLDRLPDKRNVQKVYGAVSDRDGEIDVYYCTPETIRHLDLPHWVHGCNKVGSPHPTVKKLLEDRGLSPREHIISERVSVMSMRTLVQKYEVESVDYLKIDTEGHDVVILNNYIEVIREGLTKPARKILFESNTLANQSEVDLIIFKLIEIGYRVQSRGHDTVMLFQR